MIGPDGCIKCISTIVDNDDKYTVLKCSNERSCQQGFFKTTIPVTMSDHPYQNLTVCRKCHKECKICDGEGNRNCLKEDCVNYYSRRDDMCVASCSHNEYLDEINKVFFIKKENFYKLN